MSPRANKSRGSSLKLPLLSAGCKNANYFFRLSRYQKEIEELLTQQAGFVRPESRRNEGNVHGAGSKGKREEPRLKKKNSVLGSLHTTDATDSRKLMTPCCPLYKQEHTAWAEHHVTPLNPSL
eukprot:scaffold14797_cov20-Tisochrysis_lutea.AAC.1